MPSLHRRVRTLKNGQVGPGPVVYWMNRDQRIQDNWALLYAQGIAQQYKLPLIIIFTLRDKTQRTTARTLKFMLEGLKIVEVEARKKGIPFVLLLGEPMQIVPEFLEEVSAGVLVADFSPLKLFRKWREELILHSPLPFFEVDAHNIIPVWITSSKAEFAARTIRPKIHKLLPEFLDHFPNISQQNKERVKQWSKEIDWEDVYQKVQKDDTVPPINWIRAGEANAINALHEFIESKLTTYAEKRNDPNEDAQSNLSPYLHFGQLAAQRVALEVEEATRKDLGLQHSANVFLEELIVRRELSDNFCHYTTDYDTPKAWPNWAKQTLNDHRSDPRDVIYDLQTFEFAHTHDQAWNAAQLEMLKYGKMHGYMRMYWAKKILEWSTTPEDALRTAIYLNDKYSLDGRDPNGYVGIQWSIAGVHDRPWFEREIFGKVRYMNFNGLGRKFNVQAYIEKNTV